MTDLLKNLPPMEHEFEISIRGNETNIEYKGKFKYRKPNNKVKVLAEKKRAELDGPNVAEISLSVQKFNYMVAFLAYTLLEAPEWWRESDNGYALFDYNVVEEVFNHCDKFETEWNKKVWGSKEESEEPNDQK